MGCGGGGFLGRLFAQSADEVKNRTALVNLVVVLAMFTRWRNLLQPSQQKVQDYGDKYDQEMKQKRRAL